MPATKSTAFIATARQSIAALAEASAQAEAALVKAEAEHAEAARDDGSDPGTIYNRTEAARRAVGIAAIQANRAAAALTQAEENFQADLGKAAPAMIADLAKAAAARREALAAQLAALQVMPADDGIARDAFIETCAGVADRERAADHIRHYQHSLDENGETTNLAAVVIEAAALL